MGDDKVRLLEEVLEGFDFTKLDRAYSDDGSPAKTNPKTMFVVLIAAKMFRLFAVFL